MPSRLISTICGPPFSGCSGLLGCAARRDDAAEPDGADLLRIERIADVVLDELARAPARDVQKTIVDRQIDVGDERRHRLEPLQNRRQLLRIGGLGGNLDHLLDCPLAVRSVRVLLARRDTTARSTTRDPSATRRRRRTRRRASGRARAAARASSAARRPASAPARGAGGADPTRAACLPYFPPSSSSGFTPSFTMLGVPHVLVTIVSSPRCHQTSYASCCGPRSISQRPRTSNVSGSRMNVPPGPLPSGAPSALMIDAVRSAVHGVRRGVARSLRQRLRLDHLDDPRLPRIGLRVEDVNARRVDARHDQIPPLHVRMRRVRAQAGTAGVPAEVMQLVAGVRHVGLADETAVAVRLGIDVHDADRVSDRRSRS